MFKTNGRISIKKKGTINAISITKDTVSIILDDDEFIVNDSSLLDKCEVGNEINIEGYCSLGRLYISSIG